MNHAPAALAQAPVARSTDGRVIYAVGDVHGRYDLLLNLLAKIRADSAGEAMDRPPLLIFLGDYIDRGPSAAKVVEALIQLGERNEFELRLLKGNHEAALLDFLADPAVAPEWLRFGGAETLVSYGLRPRAWEEADEETLRDEFLRHFPETHRRFLETLEPMVVVGAYAFVHAGVRPGLPLDGQDEDDLLWIREEFLSASGPFEKIIVHGHTPEAQPQLLPHRLGIDTGAYATGVLTAVRLRDGDVALLQSGAAGERV